MGSRTPHSFSYRRDAERTSRVGKVKIIVIFMQTISLILVRVMPLPIHFVFLFFLPYGHMIVFVDLLFFVSQTFE
jgi:hypothetical protein